MNGSSGFVTVQGSHLNHFIHDALTGYGRISVNENGTNFGDIAVKFPISERAGQTFRNGIYRFQVGRIGQQADKYLFARVRVYFAVEPEVIFYVAVKVLVLSVISFKFYENIFEGLFKNVGQHIEPASVGHTHEKGFHTL